MSEDWVCPRCACSPEMNNGYLSLLADMDNAEEGYDTKYYSKLASLEADNFWFRFRNKVLIWAMRTFFSHSRQFLEIGSGTGVVLSGIHSEFPDMNIMGSDMYPQGFSYAKARVPDAVFLQMNACSIPFEDEFDVVGAFDILEHIQEDEKALQEIYKALHKGGGIVLTVPQYMWLWSDQDKAAFHVRRYSQTELKRKLESAGFSIVHITSFMFFLFPIMVFSRVLSRVKKRSDLPYDGTRELKLNPKANALFDMVCNLELFFLKKRVQMPVGGSILCIGVKE